MYLLYNQNVKGSMVHYSKRVCFITLKGPTVHHYKGSKVHHSKKVCFIILKGTMVHNSKRVYHTSLKGSDI